MSGLFQQITYVAIKRHGKIFCLPKPYRHHHIIRMMVEICGIPEPIRDEQGFMSNVGEFFTREEAAELALLNGQIKKLKTPPKLFSEDIW